MKFLYLLSLVIMVGLLTVSSWAAPHVMSYQEWKKQRVSQANLIHGRLVQQKRKTGGLSSDKEDRLKKARLNAALAEEMGPHDYFELYLIRNYPNNFEALKEAARQMKPEELAEILVVYAKEVVQKNQGAGPASSKWYSQSPDHVAGGNR